MLRVIAIGLHLQHALGPHADGGVVDEAQVHMPVGRGLHAIAHLDGCAAAQQLAAAVGPHDTCFANHQADPAHRYVTNLNAGLRAGEHRAAQTQRQGQHSHQA